MHSGEEFTLSVVNEQVGGLDIAVLRINAPPPGCASLPREFLPLPLEAFSARELMGAPIVLIHSSIAWSPEARADGVSENRGYIVTSDATRLHYDASTYKGHSGAALLLRGEAVIGLLSEGFNDLQQDQSEHSPSTGADAVRLDLLCVREAVERAKAPARGGRSNGSIAHERPAQGAVAAAASSMTDERKPLSALAAPHPHLDPSYPTSTPLTRSRPRAAAAQRAARFEAKLLLLEGAEHSSS